MDDKIHLWIEEIRRFNPVLHLMGTGMLTTLEQDVEALLPLLEEIHEQEMADLGTGAGFPAIPFKILHPETRIVLIERSGKKCTFLRHLSDKLQLDGLEIMEADPMKQDIGRFEAAISRAFSPAASLEKIVSRILKGSGRFYYLYAGNNKPELGQRFKEMHLLSHNTLHLAVYEMQPELTAA
jgi:16S rRNA (guanine527-N7)-methyltransferase